MDSGLYDFYAKIQTQGILFCFTGPVSQDIVEGIGETLRHNMEIETDLNTTQKVFAIFVEQMQNIITHSAEVVTDVHGSSGELRSGMLIVGKQDDHFYVLCGNKIRNSDIENICQYVEKIRSMNKQELKQFYKERLKRTPMESSKGAGLGLIDMARKASLPLDYEISNIDQELSFFSIKVII